MTVRNPFPKFLVLGALFALAGCAASNLEPTTAASLALTPAGGESGAQTVSTAGYELSGEEREYDCKRLAGHLQIRILELRSQLSDAQTSVLSRTLNTVGTATLGGTSFGLDPKSDRVRDLKQIHAYNEELVHKNCKSFDLVKALTGNDMPPSPTVPAPSSN